jgi:signal transduction histidine kinase
LVAALRANIEEAHRPMVKLMVWENARPSPDVELALYRICQEALNNAIKHAGLKTDVRDQIQISLSIDHQDIHLVFQDRGTGFSPEEVMAQEKGIGFRAMQNWGRKVGAEVTIDSHPGFGTRIQARVRERS